MSQKRKQADEGEPFERDLILRLTPGAIKKGKETTERPMEEEEVLVPPELFDEEMTEAEPMTMTLTNQPVKRSTRRNLQREFASELAPTRKRKNYAIDRTADEFKPGMGARLKYKVARHACHLAQEAIRMRKLVEGDPSVKLPGRYVNKNGTSRKQWDPATQTAQPLLNLDYQRAMRDVRDYLKDITADQFAYYLSTKVNLNPAHYKSIDKVKDCTRLLNEVAK